MSDDIIDWDATPEEDKYEGEPVEPSTEVTVVDHSDDEVATLVQVTSTGEEITTEVNFSSPPLTKEQAVELTDSIKTQTNLLYMLIKRAHAGKAYEALGYSTFKEYIENEFSFSKVYAYRLLNQANFIEAIAAKVPEGTEIHISEPVTKKLKHALPELLEEIEDRTSNLGADEAGAVIEDIIRDRREQQREAEEAAALAEEEDIEDDAPYSGNGTGNGGGNFVDEFEDEDIDFDDSDDDDALLSEDSADVRRKFDKLYNLYTGLKNINAVGEGDELIGFLPPERWEEFTSLFESVIPWATDFYDKFKTYKEEQEAIAPTEVDDDDIDFSEDFE